MADQEVLAKFREMGVSNRSDMIERTIAWINDENGSSYNGQIVFNLSNLGQTNRWISYAEAIVEIPYVIALKSNINVTAPGVVDENLIYMKDGFHQLIDSVTIEFNQKTVMQVQNFNNMHTQFKLLTTCSFQDLIKNRATNGFTTDVDNEYSFTIAPSPQGIGFIGNNGVTRKGVTTAFNIATASTAFPSLASETELKTSGKSYFSNDGAEAANRIYYYVVMAQIRLSDISDFFSKIPLCKTTDVRLTFNYNSVVTDIGKTGSNYTLNAYSQLHGHTCPFLINPSLYTGAESVITIRSNIAKSGLGESATLPISNCRLYVPIYKPNDSVSMSMIQSYPMTSFEYNDLFNYVIPVIPAGQSFNYTITTGIVDAQYLCVLPFPKLSTIEDTATPPKFTGAITTIATYQSPFDSAGGTTSNIWIRDFQCQIGGLNVFNANERYDFEAYNNEVSKINALFGNNVLGMTNGIVDYDAWQSKYRMYIADLSRRETSQDNVIKSVVISGVNTAKCGIELVCFIAYKKKLTIRTATGTIEE